ncbi:MAG: signal peptide peptidase SppA [Bacteroidales bacterium]|nr:signal peptide peptidase SppA [Bacteroidota bacterium]MBR6063644.1 signal peptide peptidase SppA [Bacteroidales bacterium]
MSNEDIFKPKKKETGAKKFWRIVFGTMVGFFLSCLIVSILSTLMFVAMIASMGSSNTVAINDNTILKLDLQKPIQEQAVDNPFDMFGDEFSQYYQSGIGLDDILTCIKAAAKDSKIKGIYINTESVSASPATLKEIHDALVEFKESGKFIYAYADNYTQGAYYLASVADNVTMSATGLLQFRGVALQVMFYKGLIDKLDVDMQIIRHGKFKSAVEPYMMDKMSEANREQMTLLANTIWNTMVDDIAAERKLNKETLNQIADNMFFGTATKAVENKLIDKTCYKDEVAQDLKKLVGLAEDKDLNITGLSEYRKAVKAETNSAKDEIAVVYAVGQITGGKSGNDVMGSETMVKLIKDAYTSENVKAIVLRVNSPGGDGTASDIIWNEIEQAKKAGKVVVTSMGDYAASGGYYISCNSNYIIAQPNTLTGSIGVFGMVPSFQRALKNKLGVTIDGVTTNKHSDAGGALRPLNAEELEVYQNFIDEFYGIFTQRVADGRGMEQSAVDEIGQGRVWAGADALKIGLVDALGNMDDAIAKAAELAKLDNYKVTYYPKKKDFWTTLMEKTSGDNNIQAVIRQELGDQYYIYQGLQQLKNAEGVQALMPMQIQFE